MYHINLFIPLPYLLSYEIMANDFDFEFDEEIIEDALDNISPSTPFGPGGMIERIPIKDPSEFPHDLTPLRIPIIPISETCAFPNIPISIPKPEELPAELIVNYTSTGEPVVFVYREPKETNPATTKGCSKVGVLGRIVKYIPDPMNEGKGQMLCICGPRVKVVKYNVGRGKRTATLKYYPLKVERESLRFQAMMEQIIEVNDKIMSLSNPDAMSIAGSISDSEPEMIISNIGFQLPVNPEVKNNLLSQSSFIKAGLCLLEILNDLLEISKIREKIKAMTQKDLDEEQKEIVMRKQLSIIQKELGEGSDSDSAKLRERAKQKKWNEETQQHFERELRKLMRFSPTTPDYSIQFNYLDTFVSLPWQEYSDKDFSFEEIEETLNRDHYGLERVKERILEQMAVAQLRKDNKAPILCLVGPPGVGKTSLGKSIAEAMGREYARVSFGGMHDEAEIRGHRRTYIGAMPGRIIAALSKLKTSNPLIILDEIDKIGKDFKGDPSTALLEVLDPEQNSKFHDNFLDADYDLSNVMFIATANTLDTISSPLRDRMEIISIPGYISAEKIEIGRRHLVKKELKENGFEENEIEFTPEGLEYIVEYYTREAGVRRFEKTIAKVLRKIAIKKVRGQEYPTQLTPEIIKDLLGKEEFNPEMYENNDYIGVVTGLAWTAVGGEILFIETSLTPGKGKLTLTGNLGDVMKESAAIAMEYLKAHAETLGLTAEDFEKHNVHIHVPEGAIPKDGPSAGITMATSLASAFTGRKVKSKIAMTGEITLRGKVLPVGGIKEKIIAAKRAGIKEILLSENNRKDILEIQPSYLEGLTFKYVKNVGDVLENALES